MKPKPSSILATISLLALLHGHARAVVVFSESFESPVVFDFNGAVFSSGWTLNETNAFQLGLRNTSQSYDGSQVAQINANNSPAGSSFSVSLPTAIGQVYTLSLRYLSYVSTTAAVRVDFGSTSSSSPVAPLTNTWYELTFDHTATATSTLLTITDVTTDTISSDLFVDAIAITTVPEPAVAGLLGLGAVVAWSRRKRSV